LACGEYVALPRMVPGDSPQPRSDARDVCWAMNRIGTISKRRDPMAGVNRNWGAEHSANTNPDFIPHFIWREVCVPGMRRSGMTTREMCAAIQTAYCVTSRYKKNVRRKPSPRLGRPLGSNEIKGFPNSDICWDSITSIEPVGIEE